MTKQNEPKAKQNEPKARLKNLTLNEWIEREGVQTVAKVLRVTESCVRHWRRGWVLPDSRQMGRIRKFTKGQVSIDKTIDEHFASSNKKRYLA